MRSQQGELFQSIKQPNIFIRLLVGCTMVVRNVLSIFTASPLTIISLAALFFFIWVSDQGQDLLLVINDFHFGPVAMYIVITILAMMNWHFPKFFSNYDWENQRFTDLFRLPFNYNETVRHANRGKIDVPRLLGVLTFFIPAFGMLRVRDIFGVYTLSGIPPVALLLIATFLIQILFLANFFITFFNRFRKLYWFSCITLLLVPFLLWPFNQSGPQDIIYLFWGLLSYGLLFALITSNRIAVGKTIFFLNDTFITPLIWTCTILPVVLFLFYCVANMFFYQVPDSRFLTLAVVLSGIIFYYILFTILTVAGKIRIINFSLLLILLMASITFLAPNNFHDITTVHNRAPGQSQGRNLDTYIKDWLNDRLERSPQNKYPIYIVNSYGGGIRAAAWASLCINRLDSLQYQKNKELFQDHVLAYSGASGGTVGLSVMCANRVFTDTPLPTGTFTRFYCSDFLTPVLTGLIGNDIWYSGWGIARFGDRSTVQERLWEHQYNTGFGWSGYAMPVTKIWDNDGTTVPLLFSNTTDVRFGRKGIYAPIGLDSTDFPGSTIVGAKLAPSYTLKLSTAAFLSARFPFLSPAGRINDEHYFLDGGVVENSGAETALQIYRVLQRIINDDSLYRGRFKVYVVSLRNTYEPEDSTAQKKATTMAQLMAPVAAAVNVGVSGNTRKADDINTCLFDSTSPDSLIGKYFLIRPKVVRVPASSSNKKTGQKPITAKIPLPLGWAISSLAMERMTVSIDSLVVKGGALYNIVHRF